MATGPDALTTFALVGILVVLVAVRLYRMARGVPYSPVRIAGFLVVMLPLFGIAVASSLTILPPWSLVVDAGVLVGTAILALPFVERAVRFEQAPGGGWIVRLGFAVPALYLGLFAVRLALDFVVLGFNPFGPLPVGMTLSTTSLVVFILVDGLFAFSTGLLVARSVGTYRAFQRGPGKRASGAGP